MKPYSRETILTARSVVFSSWLHEFEVIDPAIKIPEINHVMVANTFDLHLNFSSCEGANGWIFVEMEIMFSYSSVR